MDELTLVNLIVRPLHSVWVALSIAECVAGHWLTGGDKMVLFMGIMEEGKALMVTMWMVCPLPLELLVHASTSGLLLVACSLDVVAVAYQNIDVHVIMDTAAAHLLLLAVTIFAKVHEQSVIGMLMIDFASIRMLHSGMVRLICEGGGTWCQLNDPPWFTKTLPIPTNDSIELLLCMVDDSSVADVALELLELYVQ